MTPYDAIADWYGTFLPASRGPLEYDRLCRRSARSGLRSAPALAPLRRLGWTPVG